MPEEVLTEEEIQAYSSALTLPPEYAEATDFAAEEAIKLDYSVKLPDSFSLGKWIYKTSNQWSLWSCTSMWTTHATQILNVKKKWVEPTTSNILTPDWKDLWAKMWHSTTKYDGGDYVENAVKTALKQGIKTVEKWELVKFDAYATQSRNGVDADLTLMKRYLYAGCPIVRCIRWDSKMWNEMTTGEVKTVPSNPTWWHCIALVGWDKWWFWFINSWKANDDKKLKSRFYISNDMMKKLKWVFNFRYRVLYINEDAAKDPAYLKRKNAQKIILEVLKKFYPDEIPEVKKAIEAYSKVVRAAYPELNKELPL